MFLVHAACQDNPHVFSIQVRRKSIMIFLCNKYNSCRPLQPILNKGLESTIRPISHHFYQHLCKITFHVYIYLITTYCPTYSKMLLSGFDFNITSPFSFSSSKTRGFFFSGLSTKKKKIFFHTLPKVVQNETVTGSCKSRYVMSVRVVGREACL